jgi:hypothetical protein
MSEALRSIGFLFPLVGLGTGASPVVLVGKWWLKNAQKVYKTDIHIFHHFSQRGIIADEFLSPSCSACSLLL